jgi:hypothetical protein
MRNGFSSQRVILYISLSFFAACSMAAEYTPNAFKAPPSTQDNGPVPAVYNQLNQNQANGLSGILNGIPNVPQNVVETPPTPLNNVTRALTEREARSEKILGDINKKMQKAKNIPVENSRYIGIINGKRVYQDNTTFEYIKVEIEK